MKCSGLPWAIISWANARDAFQKGIDLDPSKDSNTYCGVVVEDVVVVDGIRSTVEDESTGSAEVSTLGARSRCEGSSSMTGVVTKEVTGRVEGRLARDTD